MCRRCGSGEVQGLRWGGGVKENEGGGGGGGGLFNGASRR